MKPASVPGITAFGAAITSPSRCVAVTSIVGGLVQTFLKAHAFNGGDAGARRKAAFEAQLNATNQHRK